MRKRFLLFLVCVLLMLLLVGCRTQKDTGEYIIDYHTWKGITLGTGESYMERFEELGLFGEHSLGKFEVTDNDFTGKLKGKSTLTIGDVSGEIHSFESLKFAWRLSSGDIIISFLPLEDIIFIVDESKKTPTIQFKFLIDDYIRDLAFAIAKSNPNIFINSKYICHAKVRINSTNLDEIYLPTIER